jgi:methyltransferase-like protein
MIDNNFDSNSFFNHTTASTWGKSLSSDELLEDLQKITKVLKVQELKKEILCRMIQRLLDGKIKAIKIKSKEILMTLHPYKKNVVLYCKLPVLENCKIMPLNKEKIIMPFFNPFRTNFLEDINE